VSQLFFTITLEVAHKFQSNLGDSNWQWMHKNVA